MLSPAALNAITRIRTAQLSLASSRIFPRGNAWLAGSRAPLVS
jgi:hypothetical protein